MTTQPSLTPAAFAAKWRGVTTTEKASAQEHFIDLCRMLGEPTPHEADPIGAQFAFEKRVSKAAGGDGFADVWKRDFFAWEYKGKNRDLRAAYVQLMGYKDDLGNPPFGTKLCGPLVSGRPPEVSHPQRWSACHESCHEDPEP